MRGVQKAPPQRGAQNGKAGSRPSNSRAGPSPAGGRGRVAPSGGRDGSAGKNKKGEAVSILFWLWYFELLFYFTYIREGNILSSLQPYSPYLIHAVFHNLL